MTEPLVVQARSSSTTVALLTMTAPAFDHVPVMKREVIDLFEHVPAGTIVDGTLGGAGHAAALLDAHGHLDLIGVDHDPVALRAASDALDAFAERSTVVRSRFDNVPTILEENGITSISGFVLDLGVSSPQLDEGARGFSFRADAPLDMRMDPENPLTADAVVNGYPVSELIDVLRSWSDERHAVRIARAIVAARPLATTLELAAVIADAIPARDRRNATVHPATRSFQAIRIEVNHELEILRPTLDALIERLSLGGVGAVLTYHSGEDKITKHAMRAAVDGDGLPGMPNQSAYEWAHRGAVTASDDELAANPRARSARLRAIRRIGEATSA